ncbi:hypothetical protein DAT300_02510 [Streptococcus suis]|nr:hypothetical protein DAT300_02510 [Streptococcus suis]
MSNFKKYMLLKLLFFLLTFIGLYIVNFKVDFQSYILIALVIFPILDKQIEQMCK